MRCFTCDSRYCWDACYADSPIHAYVVGRGYEVLATAANYYLLGYAVEWPVSRLDQVGVAVWAGLQSRVRSQVERERAYPAARGNTAKRMAELGWALPT